MMLAGFRHPVGVAMQIDVQYGHACVDKGGSWSKTPEIPGRNGFLPGKHFRLSGFLPGRARASSLHARTKVSSPGPAELVTAAADQMPTGCWCARPCDGLEALAYLPPVRACSSSGSGTRSLPPTA